MQAKTKKILFRILAVAVAAVIVGLIVFFVIRAVRNIDDMLTMEDLRYDEYSTDYDPDVDSWLQIDPDDEDVDIRWWVDSTTWDFYQLSDLIYRRTGVRVKFEKALTGDGQELSTMIAGTLPDVITITDYSTRVQLAEEGYVYSIDRLAESYAPSLLSRLPQELCAYYAGSDGHVYGVANNFYSDSDIEEYGEAGGSVLSNYAVVVRQDYLNDYLAYRRENDPSFDADSEVTTPEGFIEMCLWVKENEGLGNDNPTVCLSEFMTKASNGSISTALSALMQFFCVPREDAEGNLVYEYATEEFREVILFLNELFNKHLVISSNFGYSASNIITNIRNGRPFAVIGAIQNYSTGFEKYSAAGYDAAAGTFSESNEYVPIVLTNAKGDAPLLADMTGRGLRVSMITKDAVRVDRIIKVFDYLLSEQGQRECYYGETEGEYYNFVVRPGETRTISVNGQQVEHTYTYGQIEWTDKAKELLGAANGSGWYNAGIKQISLLQNPLYVALTSVNGAEMDTYQFYVRYNQKCALIPYTYSNIPFRYNIDTSDVDTYNAMTDLQATLENVWIEALPSIIMAPSQEQAISLYESALGRARERGYERWLEFQNASFKAYKESLGIEYAWPMNDASYAAPEVRLLGYYDEYKKPVPDYINISE